MVTELGPIAGMQPPSALGLGLLGPGESRHRHKGTCQGSSEAHVHGQIQPGAQARDWSET